MQTLTWINVRFKVFLTSCISIMSYFRCCFAFCCNWMKFSLWSFHIYKTQVNVLKSKKDFLQARKIERKISLIWFLFDVAFNSIKDLKITTSVSYTRFKIQSFSFNESLFSVNKFDKQHHSFWNYTTNIAVNRALPIAKCEMKHFRVSQLNLSRIYIATESLLSNMKMMWYLLAWTYLLFAWTRAAHNSDCVAMRCVNLSLKRI